MITWFLEYLKSVFALNYEIIKIILNVFITLTDTQSNCENNTVYIIRDLS